MYIMEMGLRNVRSVVIILGLLSAKRMKDYRDG